MKRLCKPTVLFLAALASGVAFLPVSAQSNSDWLRRQQQQQQQMRQQQELQRQQQLQQQRQQMQQQMRQQQQQQMREQMQQQQRQQMQQQLRQQQQTQQRRQISESSIRAGSQRRVGRAAAGVDASIVSKRSDRVLYSNGVAKLMRPPTSGEMRRGFTGKVTQDGRALVKINGRVFAVPAARIGVKVNRSPSMGRPQASQWSASKRAAISAAVQKLALANLRDRVRMGGRRPPTPPPGGGDNNKSSQAARKGLPAKFTDVRVISVTEAINFATKANLPATFKWTPSKKFGGVVYWHPTNKHESVRYMPGNPNSSQPARQNPYVVHMRNGKALDINGNRVDSDSEEAHIPADKFRYRP